MTLAKRQREPKTEVLFARMTPAQIDFLKRAADAEHLALATWSRRVLLQEAQRILGERPDESSEETD